MYQLHLGGGVDEGGARFGRQVVKVVARRVPEAVAAAAGKLFEAEHTRRTRRPPTSTGASIPSAWSPRSGDIAAATPQSGEATDIGEESGFHVAIGAGECAA